MAFEIIWNLIDVPLLGVGPGAGTSVIQVTATDADDANYGNSAKVVYSILQGQPYFSVDPESGKYSQV